MFNREDLAKKRKEKLSRLIVQVLAEYGGEEPVWLMDYCESIVYGNNKQFIKATDAMLRLSLDAPVRMTLNGDTQS